MNLLDKIKSALKHKCLTVGEMCKMFDVSHGAIEHWVRKNKQDFVIVGYTTVGYNQAKIIGLVENDLKTPFEVRTQNWKPQGKTVLAKGFTSLSA